MDFYSDNFFKDQETNKFEFVKDIFQEQVTFKLRFKKKIQLDLVRYFEGLIYHQIWNFGDYVSRADRPPNIAFEDNFDNYSRSLNIFLFFSNIKKLEYQNIISRSYK